MINGFNISFERITGHSDQMMIKIHDGLFDHYAEDEFCCKFYMRVSHFKLPSYLWGRLCYNTNPLKIFTIFVDGHFSSEELTINQSISVLVSVTDFAEKDIIRIIIMINNNYYVYYTISW